MIKRKHLSYELLNWLKDLGALQPGFGEMHFLCSSASGAPYLWLQEQGVKSDNLHITYATAYAALTAGRNDTLIVMPGANVTTSALTWGKDYTHMIGATSPIQVNQRARIYTSTATVSPLMTISADGCIIKNIMFDQQGSHATTAAVCTKVTGDRNYFENVTFRHIGALGVVDNSWRPFVLNSANGENYFYKCTFGNDTVDGGTATNYTIEFNGAVETARNIFEECIIFGNGSANSSFILCTTTSATSSMQLFKRCLFYNNDNGTLDTMTQAFAIDVNCGGQFIFMDCLVYGASTFQTTNSANVVGRNAYAAATSDSAVALTF